MPESISSQAHRDEWDERDWDRFLQRADVRTAKFQELFETLINHPDRDRLIACEMGWDKVLSECEGVDCSTCPRRFECEAYEMRSLVSSAQDLEKDAETAELLACFDELRDIPSYGRAQGFAVHLEEMLGERAPRLSEDADVRNALFGAQMVPAQIAGGHGIGYERDSLCGNIANCKRALRSLAACLDHVAELEHRDILTATEATELRTEADGVAAVTQRHIEDLRSHVWWQ